MARTYLWCQAWPWFLPTFPFERFEHLEGLDLVAELAAFGMKWASEHAAEVSEALEADRAERRMREGARSTFSEGQPRARAPKGASKPTPPSFEKVAIIAGWALRPCGIVFDYPILKGLQPLPRTYFYATEDADLADGVLDALRQSEFPIPLGTGFGGGRRMFRGGLEGGFAAVLRFGKVRVADLGQTARVLIARSLEDFSEGRDPYSKWVVPIAEEAARCERLLLAERPSPVQSKPKKKTGRPTSEDPQGDKRVYDARKQGQTYEAMSSATGRPIPDLKAAHERERKRRSRLSQRSERPEKG